jgi:hypothetical protein
MSNVVQFPPSEEGGGKSSISPETAERALRWAVFCLVTIWGPTVAPIRLEEAAARLRENLT